MPVVITIFVNADQSSAVISNIHQTSSRTISVDPNAETDSNHDTALTLACAGGHAQLVRILLSHHAHIEHRDKKGQLLAPCICCLFIEVETL